MSWEDLVDLVNVAARDQLGGVATVTLADSSVEVQAIFDRTHRHIDPDTGVTISTDDPRLAIRLADLPFEPDLETRVTWGDQTYRVIDVQPDGQGMAVLRLHEEVA